MVEVDLVSVGILVILVGFVLVFAGIILQTKGKTKIEGGGIIFIGPFPVFGGATSERAFYILIFVSVIFLLFFVILNLLGR